MAEKAIIKSTFVPQNINEAPPLPPVAPAPVTIQTEAPPQAPVSRASSPAANVAETILQTNRAAREEQQQITPEEFDRALGINERDFPALNSIGFSEIKEQGGLNLNISDFEGPQQAVADAQKPLSFGAEIGMRMLMPALAVNSVATSAFDTLVSSLFPDSIIEPGDLIDFAFEDNELKQEFFKQNEFAIQFTGDIALNIATGTAAVGAAKVVGIKLFTTLQTVKGGEALAKLIFVAPAVKHAETIRKLNISSRLAGGLGNVGKNISANERVRRIANQFRTLTAADAAKQAVVFEVASFVTTNSSDIVYPSSLDTSTLFAFSALGVAIPVGVSQIIARNVILRSQRASAGIANVTLDRANLGANAKAGNDVQLAVQADAMQVAALKESLNDPTLFRGSTEELTEFTDNLKTVLLSTRKNLKENVSKLINNNLETLNLGNKISKSEGEKLVEQALETLAADPTSLAGVHSLIPTKLGEASQTVVREGSERLERQIVKLEKELGTELTDDVRITAVTKLDELSNEKNILDQMQFNVLNASGEVTSLNTFGKNVMFGDDAADVVFKSSTDSLRGKTESVTFVNSGKSGLPVTVSIGEQLDIVGPAIKDLSPRSMSIVYAHMKKFAAKYKLKNTTRIVLNEKSSFLQFRLAEEIIKVNPGAASDIRIVGDKMGVFNSLEEGLQFGRIQKQFETYIELLDESRKTRGAVFATRSAEGTSEQMIAFKVDLPGGHVSTNIQGVPGRHPLFTEGQSSLEQFFLSLAVQNEKTLPESFKQGGLDSIKAFMQGRGKRLATSSSSFKAFIRDLENIDIPLNGSSLDNADKPTFVSIGDTVAKGMATREHVIEQVALREAMVFKALQESPSEFLQEMGNVVSRQDFNIARDLNMLNDAARSGPAVFVSSRFAMRNSPIMQAIANINTRVQKFTAKHIESVFDREFASAVSFSGNGAPVSYRTAISRVLSDKAALVEFGNFAAAHENAFFKSAEPTLGADGRWRYGLISEAESAEQFASNQARWRAVFDAEMPSNANLSYLRDGRITEVALRNEAHDGVIAISEITRDVGLIKSELQQITTGAPIPLRNLHLPPRNLVDNELAFVVDINGKIKRTLSEVSSTALNKTINSQTVKDFIANNQGATVIRNTDIERFTTFDDGVFFSAIDAGSLMAPKRAAGSISSGKVALQGEAAIKGMVSSLERQYNASSLRSLSLLFEKELNRVKILDDAFTARDTDKGLLRKAVDDTVFGAYRNQLLGSGTINNSGIIRDVNGVIETAYDKVFAEVRDRMGGRSVVDLLKKKTGLDKREAQKVIDTLGNYSPYSTTTQFIEEQLGHRIPLQLKRNNAQLSGVTTTLLLRFADMAQNLVNMTGTIVNTPAILNSLKRMDGETTLIYRERTAEFGPMIGTKEGEEFATLSPVASMIETVFWSFTKEGRSFIVEGRKLGQFQQQAAEVSFSLSVDGKNVITDILRKGMHYATYLSDKSEEMSRMYAHLLGVRAGMIAGITNRSALHTLGNGVANAAIGDYRSVNRPGIFRGAATSAAGLFQTFAQQLAQRTFGYIENKAVRSLAIQHFMQSALFGGKSVPGMSQLNSLIQMASDEKESVTTIVDRITGNSLETDLLLNGIIPSIPRFFGSDDSFAISGRGAADFRGYGGLNILRGQVPQAEVIKQVAQGVHAFMDQFREGGQPSVQRTAEIFATFSPNRFVARMGEVINGVAVDKTGGVIDADMRTWTSFAAAALSLRTSRIQDEIEARYQNNLLNSFDRDIKNRINDALGSIIRSNKLDEDAVVSAFESYIVGGGKPENFGPFINQVLIRAVTPKAFLEIKKFIAGKKFNQLTRLFNALQ